MGSRGGWSREKFFTVCLVAGTIYCEYKFPVELAAASSLRADFRFALLTLLRRFSAWLSLHGALDVLVGVLDRPQQP